jgi:RNA polymerase sigma-70 factor (ECF subfamily)
MEGYSVEETAAILECAPGTVKSRCSRGRTRLAPLLADLAAPAEGPGRNRSGRGRVSSAAPDPGAGGTAAANAAPAGAAPTSSDVPADRDRPDQTDEEVSSP